MFRKRGAALVNWGSFIGIAEGVVQVLHFSLMIFLAFSFQFYVFSLLWAQMFPKHTGQLHKLSLKGLTDEFNFPFCFPVCLVPSRKLDRPWGCPAAGSPSLLTHSWVRLLLHNISLRMLKARNYLLVTQDPAPAVRWRARISDSVGGFLGIHPTQMLWRRDERKAASERGKNVQTRPAPQRGLFITLGISHRPWDDDYSRFRKELVFYGPQVRLILI